MNLFSVVDDKKKMKQPFQEVLGVLNYIMSYTKTDINFSVNALSWVTTFTTNEHFKYLLRVLRYLKSTMDIKLVNKSNPDGRPIEAYVDASWESTEERRSRSGYFISLRENVKL